jgi:hypothetical protein
MRVRILLAGLILCPVGADACRSESLERQFFRAENVYVGWIHSVHIRSLQQFPSGVTYNEAVTRSLGGRRTLGVSVTEVRKGQPTTHQSIEVGRCSGAFLDAGSPVVAYQFPNGSWYVTDLPRAASGVEP